MTRHELRAFIKVNTPLIESILSVLSKEGISAEEGEKLLLWIIGLSAGHRGANITGVEFIEPMAMAYNLARHTE